MAKKTSKSRRRSRKKSNFDFYALLIKLMASVTTTAMLFMVVSAVWQFARNPLLVVSTVVDDKPKSHYETWDNYGDLFQKFQTTHLTPAFLAALAQTESSGRQWTSSEWTFSVNRGPLNLFAPVSTSFGLMQFTKPTFELAKKYCVTDTKVESEKPWYMLDGCWFNFLKNRGSASDSINIAAAYLQNLINNEIAIKSPRVTKRNAQRFAGIAHLCGPGVAMRFVQNSYYLSAEKRCGTHNVSRYLSKVFKNKKTFERIKGQIMLASKNQDRSY